MAPRFVKNGDVIVVIGGADMLPQSVLYFTDCSRGWLLLTVKSREIPSRPDLIQSDVDNYVREGDGALIASRQAMFEQDHGRRGSQRYREKFIK